MKRLFRLLLGMYLESFRSEFSEEILASLKNGQREAANQGPICGIAFAIREITGLLRGACVEQVLAFRLGPKYPVLAHGRSGGPDSSLPDEIAVLEAAISFHLSRTVHCIANHSFEGARFHAAEEDRAHARILVLQASSGRRV